MKATGAVTDFRLWRNHQLFNIDFAHFTLSHHCFPRHFHDHYVIEWVISGSDVFYCNGSNYVAQQDQLILINPGEVHTGSTVADQSLSYFSLYPSEKELQRVAESMDICLPRHFNFQQSILREPALSEKFRLLFQSLCTDSNPLEREEIFLDCMYKLLAASIGKATLNHNDSYKDQRVKLLVEFLRNCFKEEITLQQMGELVRLNPFHLVRVFKKATGVSPYEYVLILRMEYAKQLLRSGSRVQDAALASGFYDTSHFNRLFRKMAAVTPKFFLSSKGQYRTIFRA